MVSLPFPSPLCPPFPLLLLSPPSPFSVPPPLPGTPFLSLTHTNSPQFSHLGSGWVPAPSSLSCEGELRGAYFMEGGLGGSLIL